LGSSKIQINKIQTGRGFFVVREATSTDIEQFRAVRLDALIDSPASIPGDYSTYVNHSPAYWEERLKADEYQMIFFAVRESQLICATQSRGLFYEGKYYDGYFMFKLLDNL
jgi:hypothetical protein